MNAMNASAGSLSTGGAGVGGSLAILLMASTADSRKAAEDLFAEPLLLKK